MTSIGFLPVGDASAQLGDNPEGFTHNAAVGDIDGDGDVDICVGNSGGNENGAYFLLNDGRAHFVADFSPLPDSVEEDHELFVSAAQLAELDGDGHVDLIVGATAEPPASLRCTEAPRPASTQMLTGPF